MVILADSLRRITLPNSVNPNQPLELIAESDGTFRLVSLATIPQHQTWAWTEQVQKQIATSLAEFHAGMGIRVDSDEGRAFLADLDKP